MSMDIPEVPKEKERNYFQFLSNLVYLVLILLILYQQYEQRAALDLINISISNTEELKAALQKPLEGSWRYKATFNKFFGDTVSIYNADGHAFFDWNDKTFSYEVTVGYTVIKNGNEEIVIGEIEGQLPTNKDGRIKTNDQIINIKYKHRIGIPPYDKKRDYELTFKIDEVRYSDDQEKVLSFTGNYSFADKHQSIVTFGRRF